MKSPFYVHKIPVKNYKLPIVPNPTYPGGIKSSNRSVTEWTWALNYRCCQFHFVQRPPAPTLSSPTVLSTRTKKLDRHDSGISRSFFMARQSGDASDARTLEWSLPTVGTSIPRDVAASFTIAQRERERERERGEVVKKKRERGRGVSHPFRGSAAPLEIVPAARWMRPDLFPSVPKRPATSLLSFPFSCRFVVPSDSTDMRPNAPAPWREDDSCCQHPFPSPLSSAVHAAKFFPSEVWNRAISNVAHPVYSRARTHARWISERSKDRRHPNCDNFVRGSAKYGIVRSCCFSSGKTMSPVF